MAVRVRGNGGSKVLTHGVRVVATGSTKTCTSCAKVKVGR